MNERRLTQGQVEVRAAAAETRTIGGYAAKFNRPSKNLGGFIEVIDPRAFNRSKGRDWPEVVARFNHDDNMVLGTTHARTLRLAVDETGLSYEADTPDSLPYPYELVKRGDIRKSSFAFQVIGDDGDDWKLSDDQQFPQRTLLSVDLYDVAPVTNPAYDDTSAMVRALNEGRKLTPVELEFTPFEALRSLAAKMQAPIEDVRALSEENDLRKFFVRGDKSAATTRSTFGPAARMALLARKKGPGAA